MLCSCREYLSEILRKKRQAIYVEVNIAKLSCNHRCSGQVTMHLLYQ